jgi:hypothetical protein
MFAQWKSITHVKAAWQWYRSTSRPKNEEGFMADAEDGFREGSDHHYSVVSHPRITRSYLGVCPQFSTIDSQLTV